MSKEHHDPEGRSVAAWTGSLVCMAGFLLGSIALPLNQPVLFWIAVALVVGGALAGKVLTDMGYGVGGKHSKV